MIRKKIIKKRYYAKSIIYWSTFFLLLPSLLGGYILEKYANDSLIMTKMSTLLFLSPLLVLVLLVVLVIINQNHVARSYKKHSKSLKSIISVGTDSLATFKESSLISAYEGTHKIAKKIIADNYVYADIEKTTYDNSDNFIVAKILGKRYKSTTTYISAISLKLSRKLPHIIFDSKKHKGKNNRFTYSSSQLYSFEGDMDDYFSAYLPSTYEIDSLSFVSPEVLWAIREAADYDIEIIDDRVFLIGPVLENGKKAYEDMVRKILNIEKALADNIDTYRDQRLPFAIGRNEVHVRGSRLIAGTEVIILLGAVFLMFCLLIFISTRQKVVVNQFFGIGISGAFITLILLVLSISFYLKQLKESNERIKNIDESTKNIYSKNGIIELTPEEEVAGIIKKHLKNEVTEIVIRRKLEIDGWSKGVIDRAFNRSSQDKIK